MCYRRAGLLSHQKDITLRPQGRRYVIWRFVSTGTSMGPGVLSEAGGRVERDRSETQIGLNTHTLCICSVAVACSGLVWFVFVLLLLLFLSACLILVFYA